MRGIRVTDEDKRMLKQLDLNRFVQEQLGLKLESTKGPVEVLVIDHIERPSEN